MPSAVKPVKNKVIMVEDEELQEVPGRVGCVVCSVHVRLLRLLQQRRYAHYTDEWENVSPDASFRWNARGPALPVDVQGHAGRC